MKYYKQLGEQGVSLYLAIVIMVILLSIVLGAATILVSQIRMIKEMENSVVAFYAADTGIERVLEVIIKGNVPDTRYPLSGETPVGDASYYAEVSCCYALNDNCAWKTSPCPITEDLNCNASLYCVKSVGIYKNTRRAIEVGI